MGRGETLLIVIGIGAVGRRELFRQGRLGEKACFTILLASIEPGFTAMVAGPPSPPSRARWRDPMVRASWLRAYTVKSSRSRIRPRSASGSTGCWAADDTLITRPVAGIDDEAHIQALRCDRIGRAQLTGVVDQPSPPQPGWAPPDR